MKPVKNIMKKTGMTLKKWLTTNIGYKILAIVFAFVLWLVVVNIQNPASTKNISNIPVTIINEERVLDGDHVYTFESGQTASIKISGTRQVLTNLNSDDFVATADFAQMSITGAVPVTVTLSNEKSRYAGQIDITQKTTSIVINVENIVAKEMPVEIKYKNAPDKVEFDEVTLMPETVVVNVPESMTNLISKVEIEVDYEEVAEGGTVECAPVIYDADGKVVELTDSLYLSNTVITGQFVKYLTKEVPVTFERITSESPATGYEVTGISLSVDKIEVKGPDAALKNFTSMKLPGSLITVKGKNADVTSIVELDKYLPDGITIVSDEHIAVITVKISKKEVTTSP